MNNWLYAVPLLLALDLFTRGRSASSNTARRNARVAEVSSNDTSHSAAPLSSASNSAGDSGDKALVERCKNGNVNAFDEIVARHQDAIYTLCFYHLRDADDAADAAQVTFVRAWRGLKGFRGESALRTWLHRIALNVINDTASRRSKNPLPMSSLQSVSDDEDEMPPLEAVDSAPLPEARFHAQAQRRAVQNALAILPSHHRDVLVLFDVQGHPYEEVAAILELPLGTVKSRLNRARIALRNALEECRELFDA